MIKLYFTSFNLAYIIREKGGDCYSGEKVW